MNAKKAIKRLKKAQSFVSKLVEQYGGAAPPIRDLLEAAASSLSRAQVLIQGKETAGSTPKVSDRSEKKQSGGSRPAKRYFSKAARKKLSVAAKRRWAAAKRRGANTLAG
jgi:hypothetical protein